MGEYESLLSSPTAACHRVVHSPAPVGPRRREPRHEGHDDQFCAELDRQTDSNARLRRYLVHCGAASAANSSGVVIYIIF